VNWNKRDYPVVIMDKMRMWNNVSSACGLDSATRTRARKNLRHLVNKYPDLAKRVGLAEHIATDWLIEDVPVAMPSNGLAQFKPATHEHSAENKTRA